MKKWIILDIGLKLFDQRERRISRKEWKHEKYAGLEWVEMVWHWMGSMSNFKAKWKWNGIECESRQKNR